MRLNRIVSSVPSFKKDEKGGHTSWVSIALFFLWAVSSSCNAAACACLASAGGPDVLILGKCYGSVACNEVKRVG